MSCSSTCEAVHLRHLHVEQQQVERLARAASPARRGRSRRSATRGPAARGCASSSSRLTLLSSTTSRRARPRRSSCMRSSFSAAATRAYSASSASSGRVAGRDRRRGRSSSSSRAMRGRASRAPNVLAFDLSECAARRNALGVAVGERARAARRACRRLVEERVDELERRTRRRRSACSSSKVARSIGGVGHVMRSSRGDAHGSSASTSRSTRIGLVR